MAHSYNSLVSSARPQKVEGRGWGLSLYRVQGCSVSGLGFCRFEVYWFMTLGFDFGRLGFGGLKFRLLGVLGVQVRGLRVQGVWVCTREGSLG